MFKRTFFLLLTLLLCCFSNTFSQDVNSLGGKVSQFRSTTSRIGNTDIKIEYHSPLVGGRKIFGGIVPYDFVVDGKEYAWRGGSNNRTTIEFDTPVTINGQPIKAGKYGFVVLVSKKEWTLVFSSNTSWGAFQYTPENDVLRIKVKTEKAKHQEWLSYDFINPQPESVDVQLRWETTKINFHVETDFIANMLTTINEKENKTTQDYKALALIKMKREPENIDAALELIEKAFEKMDEIEEPYRSGTSFQVSMWKAELLIKKGDVKEGKALKEEMLKSSKDFSIYYYALSKYLVDDKKKEAFKLLEENEKRNPNQWTGHLAFGEYYLKENNQKLATEYFKKAFENAPENWKNYARYLYLQNKLVLERN